MQTDTSKPLPPGGYCSWHQRYSRTAVPVRQPQDEGSAHGAGALYACLPCRAQYDLTPLADRPL